jgi:CubicO group peptidase (beta-lactamase class C family)
MAKMKVNIVIIACFFWIFESRAQEVNHVNISKVDDKTLLTMEVDSYIIQSMDSLHIPGLALAVAKNGEIIYQKGYGYSNLELSKKVIPESKFLIGSITKSFTAVSIMKLWEMAMFSFKDEIGKFVPNIPDHWKPLTIEQLLNHTSGIPTNVSIPPPCKFDADPENYTRMNFLQEVMCLPLDFKPGTQWKYSAATGYDLLGMMIENLSGYSYFEFIKKLIYEPASMSESNWINNEDTLANRVSGYYFKNGTFEKSEPLDAIGEFAHGGLMSTVLDLVKFDYALFNNMLISHHSLQLLIANASLNDGTLVKNYGLGFGLTPFGDHKRIGHTGAAPGFSSSYSHFIDADLSIFVLTNKDSDFSRLNFSNEIASFFLD